MREPVKNRKKRRKKKRKMIRRNEQKVSEFAAE